MRKTARLSGVGIIIMKITERVSASGSNPIKWIEREVSEDPNWRERIARNYAKTWDQSAEVELARTSKQPMRQPDHLYEQKLNELRSYKTEAEYLDHIDKITSRE